MVLEALSNSRSDSSESSNSSNSGSLGSGRGCVGRDNGSWGPIVTDIGGYRPVTIGWKPEAVRQVVEVRSGNCDVRDAQFAIAARKCKMLRYRTTCSQRITRNRVHNHQVGWNARHAYRMNSRVGDRPSARPLMRRALSFMAVVMLAACNQPGNAAMPTAGEIRRTLLADLPLGSPATKVVAYLTERGVENSGYMVAERVINAVYRDAGDTKLVRKAIRVDFLFASDETLISITTADGFNGL